MIVMEIQAHLSPIQQALGSFDSWRLRLWNDNGGPPGYFQTRKIEDDERNEKVMDFIDTAQKRQIESEDRKKQSEKRWQFWWPIIKWVGGGIATAILGLACWLVPKVVAMEIIVWQDYLKYHPAVTEQLKNVSDQPSPAVSSSQENPLAAGGATGTR
jgi:hypothetical protein